MIKYANQPSVLPRLASGINGTDTSLTVDNWTYDAAQTPGNFVIKIENEYIYVGSRTGNVLSSLTREYEAPGAADTHPADSVVRVVLTLAGLLDLLNQVELANLLDVDTSGQAPGKVLARNATDDGYEFVTGGGGGGGGGGSAVFSATPTADVTGIGSSYTAICSLALDPGHYVLFAEASGSSSNTGTTYLQLTDGTTPVAGGYASNNSGYGHAISLVTEEIILTVPTTFTLQASRDSGGLTILKETDTNTRATGITAIMIGGSGGGGNVSYAHVREEQSSGTGAGDANAGGWNTRVLNTVVEDDDSILSLASNQVTLLGAGKYRVEARCPAIAVGVHQARIYNITDSVELIVGQLAYSRQSGTQSDLTNAHVVGRFTITGSKVIELQHQVNTTITGGAGIASGWGIEVYSELQIWKEA